MLPFTSSAGGRFACFVWLVAGTAVAQDLTPSPREAPKDQVALVYDNQRITDAERAKLIAYVSQSVPVDRWQELAVPTDTTVARLIDEYYDLFATKGRLYRQPISTHLLEIELRRANPGLGEVVSANTRVRMPPLPVRAKGRYDLPAGAPEEVRVFDAGTHAYGPATTRRRDMLPAPSEVVLAPARTMDVQRNASTTAILLDVEHVVAAPPVALPASVVVVSSRPTDVAGELRTGATIDLLAGQTDDCLDAFADWPRSPYRQRREQVIAGLSAARRQAVIDRASRRRLVILDTQVGLEHGHGFKVASVARQTLERLGVPEAAAGIDVFDLLPSTPQAASALHHALEAYRATKPRNTPEGDFDAAARWIDATAASATGTWPPSFDMPDVLLQAVLRTLLIKGNDGTTAGGPRRTWVNMSFRIDSPALRAIIRQFDPTKAIGFVAAGNESAAVRVGYTPHDGASTTSSFVLVTHGTPRGPLGSVGPAPNGVGPMVSLVAIGCGFPGLAESGSSFAAPHVAASAWLHSLLIEDEARADDVRAIVDELRVSSRPVPGFERTVSHGLFDPQQVLASPASPHLVMADDHIEPLRSFTLDLQCRDAQGIEGEFYRSTTRADAMLRTFSLARTADGAGWQMLVRTADVSRPVRSCLVDSLRFEASTDTRQIGPLDLDSFAASITTITGRVP